MPFGTSRYLFWKPTGIASRTKQNFLAQAPNIFWSLFSPTLRCSKTNVFFEFRIWNVDVSLLRKLTFIFLKGLANKNGYWKIKPAAAGCPVPMSLSFVLCVIFLLPLWKKIRRFLFGVSCYKKWLLTNFVFFILLKLIVAFEITPFLLFSLTWTF